MTNPIENQNRAMFLFRRFTQQNFRRATGRFSFFWTIRDSDDFWMMHDYYGRMTLIEIMEKEARREKRS